MRTVADLVVDRLLEAGVRTIFGVPGGGSNLDLIEAATRAGLPFVLTATETAAVLAALAQAEITTRPGACLTTLGPGAASAMNGVACAFLDRAPLLVFTDDHPSAARGAYAHQRLDQDALFRPITKWSGSISSDTAADRIDNAIALATAPPPGPVHLGCPGDVAAREVAQLPRGERPRTSHAAVAEGSVERLDAQLAASRRPMLLVGLGARRPADVESIRGFCERRSVPAMVTYKGKGVVPDGHPSFAGVFTNASIEQPLVEQSDLLIGVGLDPVELIPRRWTRTQPIVYCGRWEVENAHVPFAAQLVLEVPPAIELIESRLPPSAWDLGDVRRFVDEQRRAITIGGDGLTPDRLVEIVADRLAASSRVTVDAGAHMFPATMLWPVSTPDRMLISNGLSTMGFALPAAVGAALADRGPTVVALTGDGGLLMCVAELMTAVRERLRIIVIVFNDSSLSLIDIKQQARGYRQAGVALGAISWPALAASFGVPAFCAAAPRELERCIDRAVECDGPSLIEARIDSGGYAAVLRAVRGS